MKASIGETIDARVATDRAEARASAAEEQVRVPTEALVTPAEFEVLETSLQLHTDAFAPCEDGCDCIIHPLTALVDRLRASISTEGGK